jgi:hypothetical protein
MTLILPCRNFGYRLQLTVRFQRPATQGRASTPTARKMGRRSGKRTVFFEMP